MYDDYDLVVIEDEEPPRIYPRTHLVGSDFYSQFHARDDVYHPDDTLNRNQEDLDRYDRWREYDDD